MRICSTLALFGCFALLVCSVPRAIAQQDDGAVPQDSRKDQKEAQAARATEESSSKDTRVDLSPPSNDQKSHPMSATEVSDAQQPDSDVHDLRPWDPHKAAKDVEVGEFYFK